MIEPASAFCIGVYFLGVGVVSSVLYIPISLMRAIEHYHIRRNVRGISDDNNGGNNNNECFSEDEIVGVCSIMNSNSKKKESICDDYSNASLHSKPELLLIYKKKLLRDMLNCNNYLTNLNLDDKSDIYSNCGYSDGDDNNKRSPRQDDYYLSSYNCDFSASTFKELTSSTSSSGVDTSTVSTSTLFNGSEGEINVLVENEDSIFHLDYFNNIQVVKDTGRSACSSSNSTYSLVSSLDTSSTINRHTSKCNDKNVINRLDNGVYLYNNKHLSMYDNESRCSDSNFSFSSHKVLNENKKVGNPVSSFITEISEAYDVLAP
ncbi:hypothetical protein RS030_192890 [Cryptosporidium xiaoi]|uniref:Uncharacterized protein n=1 Tax=Cryptosporidium xiaoi TaxID=659607 RepID=A0AAV9Y4B8_9CRYT